MRERRSAGRTDGEMFGVQFGFVKQVESFVAASTSEAAPAREVCAHPGEFRARHGPFFKGSVLAEASSAGRRFRRVGARRQSAQTCGTTSTTFTTSLREEQRHLPPPAALAPTAYNSEL